MRKKIRRLMSWCLVVVLTLTMLPINAFAENQELQSSVILPIYSNVEEEDTQAVFMTLDKIPVYASTIDMSTELPKLTLDSTVTAEGARVQAVDDSGKIVAQTTGLSIYGNNYINSCSLFMLETLPAGEYSLQLTYGDVETIQTIALNYVLEVVDAPVITYGYISGLTDGTNAAELTLRMSGYKGNSNAYSFALVDDDGNNIPCTAEHLITRGRSYGVAEVVYSLVPSAELVVGTRYFLQIFSETAELYMNASGISGTAYEALNSEIAVLEMVPNEDVVGGLRLVVGGVSENVEYTITVEMNGEYLCNSSVKPVIQDGKGIFELTLAKNGMVLPLAVYGSRSIYVAIKDADGNSDGSYYSGNNTNIYQSSNLTLEKKSDNTYSFVLQGRNLLLDLYETDSLSFTLRKYDTQSMQYQVVGNCVGDVQKTTYLSNGSVYFEFTGSFETIETLSNGTYYELYNGEDNIEGTTNIISVEEEENGVEVSSFSCRQITVAGTGEFYFNFEQLPISVVLTGGAETASAQLYDKTNGEVVAATEEIVGQWDAAYNGYSFSFVMHRPENFDITHVYEIRFCTDGEIVGLGDYSSYYSELLYDSEVVEPSYIYVETPIFEGDSKLTLRCSDVKNLALDYFEQEPISIVNKATEIGVQYLKITPYFSGYNWYLELELAEPILWGTYLYQGNNSFEAFAVGETVLGDVEVDNTTKTILITDCYNLFSGVYTAILYDTADNGYQKLDEFSLIKSSDNVLKADAFPSELEDGSYTIEVWADGIYLSALSFYISWDDGVSEEAVIKGYSTSTYNQITYQTDATSIWLHTNFSGYAYVRYSEDVTFTNVDYNPVRHYREQRLNLSEGNGVKTIYVQFKSSDGIESRVYTWQCQKVDVVAEPVIEKVWVTVEGTETTIIPEYGTFVLNLVSTSQMSSAYAEFAEADGDVYYEDYVLTYMGETQSGDGGYLFQLTLDSRDYPFSYYNFNEIKFYLTDISGATKKDQESVAVKFGERIVLYEWMDNHVVYTNQNDFNVTGRATPNSTVTITWDNGSDVLTVEAATDADGNFAALLQNLPEGNRRVYAVDSAGGQYEGYISLVVDRTVPVISSLKATVADEQNVAVTWEFVETNIGYFLLYRDDVLIKGSDTGYQGYTDTNYIAIDALGATFKVIAVDSAGNVSEEKVITVGDEEPPTAPGTPSMFGHGTKSISFSWSAATDDIAVYKYEIYRGKEKIGTVSYNELSFKDTGLCEGTSYTYSIYALDRAGNKSESATAEFSTATLTIVGNTEFEQEYVKEGYPNGVNVYLDVDNSYNYLNVSDVKVKLQYKKEGTTEWSEVELAGLYSRKEGVWEIEELPVGNYSVKFKVADSDGTEKETSVAMTVIAQDEAPPQIAIEKPEEGSTLGGCKSQKISFKATDNIGVERVELFYSLDGGVTFQKGAILQNETLDKKVYNASMDFTEAASLESGEVYIKVIAFDKRANEGISEVVSFELDNTPPEVPSEFYVGGDKNKITVMWQYPAQSTDSDFDKFRVYRSESADGEFVCVEELDTIGYYDTTESGIIVETMYYYYVTAVDKYGNESVGTVIQGGQLIDDDVIPRIHSVLPSLDSVLQKTATLKVSATDNYCLQKCVIDYRLVGTDEWIPLVTIGNEEVTRSYVYNYEWDISNLSVGKYSIRIAVYDVSGNEPTIETREYTIEAYEVPETPILTASECGHKSVELNWSYSGAVDTLSSFALYRSSDGTNYSYVRGFAANEAKFIDAVKFSGVSQKYYYKIEAHDKYGAYATSQVVEVLALSSDSEAPVAVIGPDTYVLAAVGEEVSLTGAGSTDNDSIVLYEWDFGDGHSALGVEVGHVFTAIGDYNVRLKVTDAYGNEAESSVVMKVVDLNGENIEYTQMMLSVCDAVEMKGIAGAEVIVGNGDLNEEFSTDANGMVNFVVPNGSYTVSFCAEGYITRTILIEAEGGRIEHKVGLSSGSIMGGELKASELSYDEIVSAGIDPNAEGNQHVYKFEATLTFVAGLQSYDIPYTIYKNLNGEIIRNDAEGGFFTLQGTGDGVEYTEGLNVGVFPITENFLLVIYGEAHWLKEMYSVELVVLNYSKTDTLEQVVATLELPEGLSLTEMKSGVQNVTQELGSVGYNGLTTARWYVRGDEEGEYHLTAKVNATTMPYGETIEQTFTTEDTLKVYAGSALHLTITTNDVAVRGEQYPVSFKLENVSDKTLYKLSFGITGIEQFKVLRIGNSEGELLIDKDVFEGQFTRTINELKPGEYIEIEIDATIWFNSVAEMGEKALKSYLNSNGLGVLGNFIDVVYYLQDVSVVALEGSTTEIPNSVVVNKVDRPNILISGYEAAKEVYKGETKPGTLGDTLVEVFGYDSPIWLQEGAKMIFSLPQGTTNYDVTITMPGGEHSDGELRSESISISSGTGTEMVFDTLNSVKLKADEKGTFEIFASKPGEGEISISLKNGKTNVSYKMPIIINGKKVETSIGLSVDEKTGEYRINTDMMQKIIGQIQEEEGKTFAENPYLWFASRLKIDLVATDEGVKNILSLDKNALRDLLAETVVSYVDVESDIANLSFDRETFNQVISAESETDALKIVMREIGDEAVEKFDIDRPTYEFLIHVGDDLTKKTVSDFGEGKVEVEIPYELQEGEMAEDIEVHRVHEDGTYELVPSKYDSAEGLVNFTTDQFSYYRIGLKNNNNQGEDSSIEGDSETEEDSESEGVPEEEGGSDVGDDRQNEEVASGDVTSSDALGEEDKSENSVDETPITDSEEKSEDDFEIIEEADAVVIPLKALKNFSEEELNLEIGEAGIKIFLDGSALEAIAKQATGDKITFSVKEISEESLGAKQQSVIKDKVIVSVFSAGIWCNGEDIEDLKGGKVSAWLPFVLEEGATEEDYAILHVAEDGTVTVIEGYYENGGFSFDITSMSDYVIVNMTEDKAVDKEQADDVQTDKSRVEDSSLENPILQNDENDRSGSLWWYVVGGIIFVGFIGCIVIIKKRKRS